MAGLLHATTGLFGGLNLKCKHSLRTSNGNTAKLCMKTSAPSYHVEVMVSDEEPQENAVKRFRREVMNAGLTLEVRRRRYFENTQEEKKRRKKDANQRRSKRYVPPSSFEEVASVIEPSPFAEMFGETEDLFEVGYRGPPGRLQQQ